MVVINGKKYKINMDMKWGTQKLLRKIQDDPENVKNLDYMEIIMKDMLIPKPTQKAMLNFRNSDVEKIFIEFGGKADETNADLKKKLSQ